MTLQLSLIYLAGFLSPFAIILLVNAPALLADWRHSRRYRRAWDHFGAEFDALSADRLAQFRCECAESPHIFQHICDDRSRYFVWRWQNGHTKEI